VKIHIVQKGDTLRKIAQKYGVDFEELKKMNAHLSNPDMIMPGMKIKVPSGGVPVRKEVQKKETKINIAPKKEAPKQEHPYAEQKPFISFDIEEEIVPKEVKEIPKEMPKAEVAPKEVPKAPAAEAVPKEVPKAPAAETIPKETAPEAPKTSDKEDIKDLQKADSVSPLIDAVPPFNPQVNINNHVMPNVLPNMPTLPPKPANILPEIMKQEPDIESPVEEKPDVKEPNLEQPPEMPKLPYIPPMPQNIFAEQPVQALQNIQPCVPVTLVMPEYGFNYQPIAMAPIDFQPMYPNQPMPGIAEHMDESIDYMPEMPNVPPNVAEAEANQQAPADVFPASNIPPMPQYNPSQVNPYANCVPITPVMPGYGFNPPIYYQPYAPAAPYGYGQPMTQGYSMPMQPTPGAFSPQQGAIPFQPAPSAFSPQQGAIPFQPAPSAFSPQQGAIPFQPVPSTFPGQQPAAPMPEMGGFPGQQTAMPMNNPTQAPPPYYPPTRPYAYSPIAPSTPASPFFMMPEYGESSEYED
jgi:morphogenetic protein associated with SpoVID